MENRKYKILFEITVLSKNGRMTLKSGNMCIDTDIPIEELRSAPDLNDVILELLREENKKLNIIMLKVTSVEEL